jgi:uncharacterized protein YndB with AHSA1/START domain
MSDVPAVEVEVRIAAAPGTVFPYFTDPGRYVQWMGRAAELEPVPGGTYRVQMGDGFAAEGTFTEVVPPHRVAFSWGWAAGAQEHVLDEQAAAHDGGLPAGSTRVVVALGADGGGTHLVLRHYDLPTGELREAHRVAWESYLSRLVIRASGGDPGPDPHNQP